MDWHTVWDPIAPLLTELADDPAWLAGVAVLGVDEHIWHHAPRPGMGPKELTGMVDLIKAADAKARSGPRRGCSTSCRAFRAGLRRLAPGTW